MVLNDLLSKDEIASAKKMKKSSAKRIPKESIQSVKIEDKEYRFESAAQRREELIAMSKHDPSIVVITNMGSTRYQDPQYAYADMASNSLSFSSDNATALRKILMTAQKGKKVIINLQIVMKDGSIMKVTDPAEQVQMVSQLLEKGN